MRLPQLFLAASDSLLLASPPSGQRLLFHPVTVAHRNQPASDVRRGSERRHRRRRKALL
jgi:hypothetical protein